MSTVDSGLLVISAAVVRDLVQKTLRPDLSERSAKRLSYAVTGGVGASVCVAALLIKPIFLQPLVIHYVGSAASALFWPGILTLYYRRATVWGMMAGLVGGATAYVGAIFFPPLASVIPLHPFVYGFFASGFLCWTVSRITPQQPEARVIRYLGHV